MLPELFLVLLRHSKPIKQNHDFHFGGCIVQRVMSLAKNDLRSGIEKQCPRVKCLVNREGVRDRKSSVVFDYVSAWSAPSGIVWRVVIVIGLFGYFSQTSVSIRSKETVQDSKCEGIVLIVTSLVRPMSAKKGPDFTM